MNFSPKKLAKPLQPTRLVGMEERGTISDNLIELALEPGIIGMSGSNLSDPLLKIGNAVVEIAQHRLMLFVGVGLFVGCLTLRRARAKRKALIESSHSSTPSRT